jgi:hypothetical protein
VKSSFSDSEVLWSVWFAIGYSFPRSANDAFEAFVEMPDEVKVACERLLAKLSRQFGPSLERYSFPRILLGGYALTRLRPLLSLTGRQYDEAREFASSITDPTFRSSAPPWPPSRLTVVNRLGHGSWLGVENAAGLGVKKTLSEFSEIDLKNFELSIVNFWHFCTLTGLGPFEELYKEWRRLDPENLPKIIQILQIYKSWATVMSSAYTKYVSAAYEVDDLSPDDLTLAASRIENLDD